MLQMIEYPPAPGAHDAAPPMDAVFAYPLDRPADFNFNGNIASVFDDMVGRSVPFYNEVQRMIAEIAADFAVPNTALYDLGCATGTTLQVLHSSVHPGVHFVGIDNSEEMLQQAESKLNPSLGERTYDLVNTDLHRNLFIRNASVVTMILTLQFIRPMYREQILKNICEGLNSNGCLIMFEKITSDHSLLNRLFIDYYYQFKKRNHYSDLEIAQKREALENVLIPYRPEENRELLYKAGFQKVEEFFRWYNFSALLAVK